MLNLICLLYYLVCGFIFPAGSIFISTLLYCPILLMLLSCLSRLARRNLLSASPSHNLGSPSECRIGVRFPFPVAPPLTTATNLHPDLGGRGGALLVSLLSLYFQMFDSILLWTTKRQRSLGNYKKPSNSH